MRTYKQEVLSTLKRKVNKRVAKNFTGYEITELTKWYQLKQSTAMRTLRQMKTDGVIDYICTNAQKSEYKLLSINS